MTAHTHRTLVPGCYRCQLNKDEMRAAASCWYCGDDPDGSGSTASMGWCPACDERQALHAERDAAYAAGYGAGYEVGHEAGIEHRHEVDDNEESPC